ncbi:ECF RNA polymerase sigma factor SigE [Aquisphaera giovannonii]|uniref:ECF RNA polymerase sigma factor SigE n=1 Tax=Aquisphaera giovannonii TaxID=406548 RepID=A0A5B9VWE1_9BACT|nr:sigma-70 family RNA polymerase sigma factor [Aquisphaera giovannonii]QEH32181.1 ECF RNA polymerase sigma factor SigE [Aquisphaera giovannonii]
MMGTSTSVHERIGTLLDRGTLGGEPDARLLEIFLDGDRAAAEAAFAAIVARHGAMVRRVCFGVLDHAEDAEDASQAVFLILARRARSVRRRGSVASWLHGTARHVALRARREIERRRRRERRWAEATDRVVEPPEDRLSALAREDLRRELDRLPKIDRAPIVLCHLEGLSHAEAAERLGLPLRTFQSRLLRARNRLRDRLRRAGLEPAAGSPLALPHDWAEKVARSAIDLAAGRAVVTAPARLAAQFHAARSATRMAIAATAVMVATVVTGAAAMTNGPASNDQAERERASGAGANSANDHANRILELRAVDRELGRPIEGAEIEVKTAGPWHASHREVNAMIRRRTDALGLCRIDFPERLPAFRIDARKAGYAARSYYRRVHSPRDGLPREVTMDLTRAVSIGGVVMDHREAPIAGATVNLWLTSRSKDSPTYTHIEAKSITDEHGRWHFDEVPPTWSSLGLHAWHPNFVPTLRQPASLAPKPTDDELRTGKASIVLDEGIVAEGLVLDPAGRAVPGASVVAGDYGSYADSGPGPATTDAEGRFRFHLPAGMADLTAQVKGFAPATAKVPVEPGMKPLELRLAAGRRIAGRVVDRRRSPLKDVTVEVHQWKGLRVLDWSGKTDAEGRYAWDAAPAEPVYLTFSHPDFNTQDQRLFQAGDPEADVVMHEPLRVRGRVMDARTGRPIPKFTIHDGYYEDNAHFGFIDTAHPRWTSDEPRREFTDGSYEIEYDQPSIAAVGVRIEAEGHLPATSGRIAIAGGEAVFDAKLEPAVGPSGVVLGLDGRPLAGATVVLWDGYGRGMWYSSRPPFLVASDLSTRTDAEGRFGFTPQAESFRIFIEHETGFAEVNGRDLEPAPARTPTIRLRPWARVEGTVMIGSKPAASASVDLLSEGGIAWSPGEAVPMMQSERRVTDVEGRYAFERVLPGRYTVARSFRLARSSSEDGRANSLAIGIEAGRTVRVSLGGSGRPVVGRFIIPAGIDPAATFSIQGQQLERVTSGSGDAPGARFTADTNVRPDGTFRVEDVPAGRYRLRAEVQGPTDERAGQPGRKLADADVPVIVPGASGGPPEKPLDVGTIMLKAIPAGSP